jgi:hypothetical protein
MCLSVKPTERPSASLEDFSDTRRGSIIRDRGCLEAGHNAANEYLGLIERAENGAPGACANWTAPSSGQ